MFHEYKLYLFIYSWKTKLGFKLIHYVDFNEYFMKISSSDIYMSLLCDYMLL